MHESVPSAVEDLTAAPDLAGLDAALAPLSMMAGWSKLEPSLWPQPHAQHVPAVWRYAEARAGLDSAGRMISAEQAERRNLFLVNPVEGNDYPTVRTLVGAYQMILPGERARSHRHSPNALRLVMDVVPGTYTVVDGVRIDMEPGDVLLTPGGCWHGHGNDGAEPGYWIDYLDVPLVQLLEPMFLQWHPDGFQESTTATRDSEYVFAWTETERRLAAALPDEHGRLRIQLGDPAMPTTALFMERGADRCRRGPLRTTAHQIVTCVSGRGSTRVGDAEITWERGDVLAVPGWTAYQHRAEEDAVLFTVTDQPVMEKLGFLREEPAVAEVWSNGSSTG